MKYYFKRHWEETTGEELTDAWGTSTFYFETDLQLNVIRQMQVFERGQVLKYSSENIVDEFGMLSEHQLDYAEFKPYQIQEEEFVNNWNQLNKLTI